MMRKLARWFFISSLLAVLLVIGWQLFLFVMRWGWLLSIASNTDKQKDNAVSEEYRQWAKRLPDRQSVFVYNKAFAERFGLDESKAQDLGEGMYAMELTVEKIKRTNALSADYSSGYYNRHLPDKADMLIKDNYDTLSWIAPHGPSTTSFMFECYLNLYVSDKLAIQYPYDSQMAGKEMLRKIDDAANHFIFERKFKPGFIYPPQPKKDLGFLRNSDKNSFESKAAFNYISPHFWQSKQPYYNTKIRYYKKHWQPGINYISYAPVMRCEQFANPKGKTALLLEKIGGAYYGKEFGIGYFEFPGINYNDFYSYSLPQELFSSEVIRKLVQHEADI